MNGDRYISVRIVNIDHYLADPSPFDRRFCPFSAAPLTKVPVIRIFGSTATGQKACLHIHQAYPYFYVPYTLPSDNADKEQIEREIYQFGASLNQAIALSRKTNTDGNDNNQHIAAITLVKGVPFYGYHVGFQTFLKICLLNPADKQRVVEILQNGAVLGKAYQPHEAHIPFELQFMIDYNLYGMDWIHIHPDVRPLQRTSKKQQHNYSRQEEELIQLSVRFRQPLLDEPKTVLLSQRSVDSPTAQDTTFFTAATVPSHLQWSHMPRSSYCELELDTTVMTIGNRRDITERNFHVSLRDERRIMKEWLQQGKQRMKLVTSLASIWKDEENRRKSRGAAMPSSGSQPEGRTRHSGWDTEAKWRRMIEILSEHKSRESNDAQDDARSDIPGVLTTFHAVEALYNEEYFKRRIHATATEEEIFTRKRDSSFTSPTEAMQTVSKERTSKPRTLQEKLEALEQQREISQYNVSATPSRYKSFTEGTPTDVDADVIHALIRNQSFHDGEILDDDRPEDENVYEEVEPMEWMETTKDKQPYMSPTRRHVPIEYDSEDGEDDDGMLFRSRKIDFEAEVRRMEAREKGYSSPIESDSEKDDGLRISEVPPSVPHRHRRWDFHLPQYDGADDGELPEQDTESSEDAWRRHIKMLEESRKRKRSDVIEYSEPYVEIEEIPELVEFVTKKYQLYKELKSKRLTGLPMSQTVGVTRSEDSSKRLSSAPATQPSYFFRQRESGPSSILADQEVEQPTISTNDSRIRTTTSPTDYSSASKPLTLMSKEPGNQRGLKRERQDDSDIEFPHLPTRRRYEYMYRHPPPTVPSEGYVKYQEPFYSNPVDVPAQPKIFANKEFRLKSKHPRDLKPFDPSPNGQFSSRKINEIYRKSRIRSWTPAIDPPSVQEVKEWLRQKDKGKDVKRRPIVNSQLEGPTAKNTHDFKISVSKPEAKVTQIRDYLDLLSVEIHVNTRGNLLPDPEHDAVQAIFYCLQTEDENIISNGFHKGYHVGVIAVGQSTDTAKLGLPNVDAEYVQDEEALFRALIDKVHIYDPDLLVGYELHNASWGYLIERAAVYDINLVDELSRVYVTSDKINRDQWGYRKASVFRVIGRHMINVWRIMRSEMDLTSYTFENTAYNLLDCRMPHFSYRTLTAWYTNGMPVLKHRLYRYFLDRVQMNLDMLDISETIRRTSESARVFGVDFYSVITRGSQFKVESIMFRIAKPENFVLVSPSRKQVGQQRAAECLPLIMEPETQFYNSPLLVLDFQSLYPSVMIAYNYCFSTCLGKVRNPEDPPKFGIGELDIPASLLNELKDDLNVSPNGVMFVKPHIRKSLLAKMLSDILDTRVMVKCSMKEYKDDPGLLRLLDARQLTLKYIANVTYGYTSATFSGRMPAVEIADSIVQTGRETLEKAIKVISETTKWNARVVYGDTDSVFVYLPGRTREQAFQIGNEIAETVTNMNPEPIRLRFEKVYHPCVLIAKKRYVGFKYEKPGQEEPEFEAKGIETVRRDGTVATQKVLESSLKILFRTQDMSMLKEYLYRQWTRILSGRVTLQDFIIAREVRLGTYTEQGLPHGAQVAQAKMAVDPRAAPQYGERVPYVVVYRGPNARLKDKVVRPEAILIDNSLRLDAEYYIRKQIIPPLERVFNLMGVDIAAWYDEMPRSFKSAAFASSHYAIHVDRQVNRIDQYYASSHCVVCRRLTDQALCDVCKSHMPQTIYTLSCRQSDTQTKLSNLLTVCESCSGVPRAVSDDDGIVDHPCDSLDCPVFFARIRAKDDVRATSTYDDLMEI